MKYHSLQSSQSSRYGDIDKRLENRRVILSAGADSCDVESKTGDVKEPLISYDYVVTDVANQTLVKRLQDAKVKNITTMNWVRQSVICGTPQALPIVPELHRRAK